LEDREVELLMSGMTITPECARRVAFVGLPPWRKAKADPALTV
jgi:hypothetical protein